MASPVSVQDIPCNTSRLSTCADDRDELKKRFDTDLSMNDAKSTEEQVRTVKEMIDTVRDEDSSSRGLKILFLSSDTGGGHRASAESLAKQFQLLFPGTTYDLIDVVAEHGVRPYSSLVSYYKHLSAHPTQWRIVYGVSNSRAFEIVADAHLKLTCERAVRRRIKSYDPDVVVSVHPMMNNVPVLSCARISHETGKHLPMFTVVTDLGSAHCMWFANEVEKMFVGSQQVHELARTRGKVPEEKLVKAGLPIRHDFALQSEKMGNRMSPEGKEYQRKVREALQFTFVDRRTILIMGGGEGVGSLSNIVNALYFELVSQGIDANLLVVCGRNERLKKELEERDWNEVIHRWRNARERHGLNSGLISMDYCVTGVSAAGCFEASSLHKILSSGSLSPGNALSVCSPEGEEEKKSNESDESDDDIIHRASSEDGLCNINSLPSNSTFTSPKSGKSRCKMPGKVEVVGLGFVTQMADYMVASDLLVSKAGPGTISEAAALSLPVLLTSFLPGQEEGNVDFVVDGGFGVFCSDSDPIGIAEEACMWLSNEDKLKNLSDRAKACGVPHAARDIAQQIGDSTLKWREINSRREKVNDMAGANDVVSDDSISEGNTDASLSERNVDIPSAEFGGITV